MEKVSPRVDFVFKKIFGAEKNKDILIDLINSIVDEKDQVIDIEIRNPYNDKEFKGDKLSILDIKAQDKLTETWFNIEMQIADQDYFEKRALYYWSRTYSTQLGTGYIYNELKKTISINFLNFSILEEENYHNCYKMYNRESLKEAFNDIEIHFIELNKFHGELKTALDKWTYFLKESGQLDKAPKELEEVKTIKKAFQELQEVNFTEGERELYDATMKHLRDRAGEIAKVERIAKEEGKEERNIEIAKQMLKENISVELISKITGLTIEEVEKLK